MSEPFVEICLGRPVRFDRALTFVWFERWRLEALFDRIELERLAELHIGGRLMLCPNGGRNLYVRLACPEWKDDRRSVARILESIAGNGDLERREVRYKNRNTLDLRPENRVVSKRGPHRGDDKTYQETARRVWVANNSAHSDVSAQRSNPSAPSPLDPPKKPNRGGKRKRGADSE